MAVFILGLMRLEDLYQIYLKASGVSIDTRSLEKGDLFFALKGDNFNGNEYASQALKKGAKAVVLDDVSYSIGDKCVVVKDVIDTFQALARFHRDQIAIPVIGITGSNGKTTTKELLDIVLKTKFNCFATKGNYNNHLGVPLSILSINLQHEIAIIEMGANHQGEIDFLSKMAKPSHGMITNIGKAHLEGFGGINGVKKGKSELYKYLENNKGVIFFNEEDEVLKSILPKGAEVVRCKDKVDYTLESQFPYLKLCIEGMSLNSQLTGTYNVDNIIMALSIGKHFNVDLNLAIKAIERYRPENNRSQILNIGSNTFIMDAYNANPSSMKLAIENMSASNLPNKILILGSMKELGDYSVEEHQSVLKELNVEDWFQVYTIGDEFYDLDYNPFKKYRNVNSFKEEVNLFDFTKCLVLLKGSRSVGLEKIVEL